MRSTSPPKSAWPGVSTMLIRVSLPFHRRGLGENGDAALLLDVARIHRAFLDAFVFAVDTGLLEQFVDQRGLAMVNVGDDRNIAQGHRI
jgi:hypothetical protein